MNKLLPHPHAKPLMPRHGGQPTLLFLLLHGLGAQSAQMMPLAHALHRQYPDAAIVAIDGPHADDRIPGGGHGYQWYSEQSSDGSTPIERLQAALPDVLTTIRSWQAFFELDHEHVALAGFSQGATMALEAVQREPALVGRVLAFGGSYLVTPEQAPEGVCVHLLQGMNDADQPYRTTVDHARALLALGADVTADVLPDIGHELHPLLIDKAMEQLRSFIPARLWREAMLTAAEQDRTQH